MILIVYGLCVITIGVLDIKLDYDILSYFWLATGFLAVIFGAVALHKEIKGK